VLSQEEQTKLIIGSKPAAAALLEDLPHIREILSKPTSPSDVRRLSAVLRRVLVERDLTIVASPRIGRIRLVAPDNNLIYKADKKHPLLFFGSGGANIFGGDLLGIYALDTTGPQESAIKLAKNIGTGWDQGKRIELKLDSFLTQRVLCLRGQWVSRSDVIKYIANISSGIHTGTPVEENEIILAQISRSNSYRFDGKGIAIDLFKHGIDSRSAELKYTPDAIDPVLVEVLSAARFLTESPDVARLEQIIADELLPRASS
jgi:hypothetical protein